MIGGIIEEISKRLKIWQDTSSAYHPAGNKLIENAVGRIKKAIADRKIEDSMMDIIALNLNQPYSNKTLTPFEELFAITSPVNGIPMTDKAEEELVKRDWLTNNLKKTELQNTIPLKKPLNKEDTHDQTNEETQSLKNGSKKLTGITMKH